MTGKIMIASALALLLAGAAGARTSSTVIASSTSPIPASKGLYYYIQASTTSPKSMSAKVTTSSKQKVLLQWSIACSNGLPTTAGGVAAMDPSTKQKAGQKSVPSPATATLPLPFAHPKSCSVSLYAKLSKKATTTLVLLKG